MSSQFREAHERLKHSVHSYWRQNTILSPRSRLGKVIMGSFYFSIPVVLGYYVSTKAVDISESTVQERFGKTDVDSDVLHVDRRDNGNEKFEKIGAGGWGGGVNLATSSKETQEVNRINFERFMKKQRKLKKDREAQENP
mmetsp:Transcript_47037/g.52605  ORF Transcript_47037/g.52605 Transcript_47037/m.52605 type:complete len:140 (+) Transcript_47037:100-519(+)